MKHLILIFLLLCFCSTVSSAQINVIDSLQQIVSQHPEDTVGVIARLNLIYEFSRKDSQKAKSYCYQAIELSTSLQMMTGLSRAYSYLITLHQNSGLLDSARHYLNLLEKISNQPSSKIKLVDNYYQTAGLFYKNQGQYTKALPFMLQTLELLKVKDENYAGQLLNIGNTYIQLSDYKAAMKYHLKSLSLFEKLNNKRGQSFCLQSLGSGLFKLRQFEQSRDYFERSITLKEELKDTRGLINGWTGLADVYTENNQFELSEKYYLRGLAAAKEMKLIREEARCNNQLALLYKRMGLNSKSQIAFTAGLALARQSGDSSMSAIIQSGLLGLAIQEQKEKRTENTLLSNLTTHIKSGDRSNEAAEYSHLAEYYAANNKFDMAFNYLKKHEQLKDSVEGNVVLLQIKELEEQFQSEKKEQEIVLLKKDQELHALALSRERSNVILIAIALISVLIIGALLVNRYRVVNRSRRTIEIERMRNTIARDLHDDIGSTLSSINILSQVALAEKSENTQNYLQRIGDQSARIMEDMSDIVWSINPHNDSMDQIIIRMREFSTEIFESKNIDYRFSEKVSEELTLDSDKRKNLFLIFKETVNNAAKYSNASKIEISLSQIDHTLVMRIKDNGQGFDEQTIKSGNGLRNLRERAKEINAAVTLKSVVGEGTEMELRLPIA